MEELYGGWGGGDGRYKLLYGCQVRRDAAGTVEIVFSVGWFGNEGAEGETGRDGGRGLDGCWRCWRWNGRFFEEKKLGGSCIER